MMGNGRTTNKAFNDNLNLYLKEHGRCRALEEKIKAMEAQMAQVRYTTAARCADLVGSSPYGQIAADQIRAEFSIAKEAERRTFIDYEKLYKQERARNSELLIQNKNLKNTNEKNKAGWAKRFAEITNGATGS